MGDVCGPVFGTGGHIRKAGGLIKGVGYGVHRVDEVHEQRIDIVNNGHGNGDLEEADHVTFLSFRCSQYTGKALRLCERARKNVGFNRARHHGLRVGVCGRRLFRRARRASGFRNASSVSRIERGADRVIVALIVRNP